MQSQPNLAIARSPILSEAAFIETPWENSWELEAVAVGVLVFADPTKPAYWGDTVPALAALAVRSINAKEPQQPSKVSGSLFMIDT